VGGVDHLVGLGGRPVRLLDERPRVVEEIHNQPAMRGGIELPGGGA
jgi:hypothetical protein